VKKNLFVQNLGKIKNKKAGICGKLKCGPCVICTEQVSAKYFHLSSMDKSKNLYQKILSKASKRGIEIGTSDCICSRCREASKKDQSPVKRTPGARKIYMGLCFLNLFNMCTTEATTQLNNYASNSKLFKLVFSLDDDVTTDLSNVRLCKRHFMVHYITGKLLTYCTTKACICLCYRIAIEECVHSVEKNGYFLFGRCLV